MTTGHYGSETSDVYVRAGFGAAVPRGRRPVVLVVDLTRAFTDPSLPSGADLTAVVAGTGEILTTARSRSVPVVFTTIAYTPAEASGRTVAWLDKATGMRALAEGTPLVEIDPRLERRAEDVVITKKGASAFFGTSLATVLTGLRCDTLVVCGATTSGCVRASVVDAVQSGFPVLVPRDCVGDRAPGPHEANLFDIAEKYGDVVEQEDVLGYLAALPSVGSR